MKQFNVIAGSGGRDRTGDLRIMIPRVQTNKAEFISTVSCLVDYFA
jgi:hypothetical protein